MVKIDVSTRDKIRLIFLSHVDSQGRLKGSHESIYREILPLLPGYISLEYFQSALIRSQDNGTENLQKGFNQFIKSLEIWTKTTDKTKARPQEKKISIERSRAQQNLGESPIDKGHQQMRLDDCDRLMATARCPDYIEDWNCLISEVIKRSNGQTIEALRKELCQKWKLNSPIPPYMSKKGKESEIIFKANEPEPILELNEDEWPNSLFASLSEAMGRYMFVRLRIDLDRDKKELLNAFRKRIKSWTKKIPKKKKPRRIQYDPWEIWDLHKKSGLSLRTITRQKNGTDYPRGPQTPAYNEEPWPPYKRVQRAYKQAQRMIQAAKPLYRFPIRSLVDV